MKTIVFATNNSHKVAELADFFDKKFPEQLDIKTLAEVGFYDEIIEDADTFEGNAYIKANTVCRATGLVAIADDSGLKVDFLGGKPGVFSARYAGEGCNSEDNIKKLLRELDGVPKEKRTARFVSVLCAYFPDGRTLYAKGTCEGVILTEKTGNGTFGYDPIFYYEPLKKSFAELDIETKNQISHRGKALQQFEVIFDPNKA
ncbi:MAG: non-canonical purine NTP pyrophosphatase, RdgB/HAM1 family [Clostridiales bacterium GWF2_36_10]|nr:MAG: non-canonical purine NTP pyrophosphatase, RdgB/HAM1 family [Clostridiales bacterium GWF2_36_10]HAN21130.1 non-canonical purine NTP pyrophosphatase [Clostridiales bacterium]